jgi:serine/threonine protein kinase, bacterial
VLSPTAGEWRRILLADFGIARNIDDISGLTATNMTVGTVAYCAPEQLMGKDVDGRADLYALTPRPTTYSRGRLRRRLLISSPRPPKTNHLAADLKPGLVCLIKPS